MYSKHTVSNSMFKGMIPVMFVLSPPQYYADANEAESWMKEKMPLVCSDDYGKDEAGAQVRSLSWLAENICMHMP